MFSRSILKHAGKISGSGEGDLGKIDTASIGGTLEHIRKIGGFSEGRFWHGNGRGSSIFEHTARIFDIIESGLAEINRSSGGILEHISGIFSVFEGGITEVDIFKHGTLKN